MKVILVYDRISSAPEPLEVLVCNEDEVETLVSRLSAIPGIEPRPRSVSSGEETIEYLVREHGS